MNDESLTPKAAGEKLRFGMSDSDLASRPTVFRSDLLKDKSWVVSGGGSGIGKAIAFLAARLGAEVTICGRTEDKLNATRAAIKAGTGRDVAVRAMSIREPQEVEALLDDVFDRNGRIDMLINNAGGQFPQDAIDFSRKGWLAVVDLNLNGTWWMMQEAARRWRDRGQAGNIINIVANVERGMPQAAHTCAARAGIIYLSKTVATEWAPLQIRVNCIAPGTIETEGFSVYPPHALERFHEANPMKRLGDAWDIAEAAMYLGSDAGAFVTGEVLTIDGGMAQWGVVWPAGIPDYFNVGGGA
ncbi:MAG TPA: SDR family oxidoreductase [Sphingomicrobium sp.]|nr:SDR family oxidoreductase [Sphingomicrobium sp.]